MIRDEELHLLLFDVGVGGREQVISVFCELLVDCVYALLVDCDLLR